MDHRRPSQRACVATWSDQAKGRLSERLSTSWGAVRPAVEITGARRWKQRHTTPCVLQVVGQGDLGFESGIHTPLAMRTLHVEVLRNPAKCHLCRPHLVIEPEEDPLHHIFIALGLGAIATD